MIGDTARPRGAGPHPSHRGVDHQQAAAVVDAAFRAGGGSSIYADSPLQRRFRDIHTITQHFLVKDDTLTTAGAMLAGQDPAVMVF